MMTHIIAQLVCWKGNVAWSGEGSRVCVVVLRVRCESSRAVVCSFAAPTSLLGRRCGRGVVESLFNVFCLIH